MWSGGIDGVYVVVVGEFVVGWGDVLGGDGELFWVGEVGEFVGDFFSWYFGVFFIFRYVVFCGRFYFWIWGFYLERGLGIFYFLGLGLYLGRLWLFVDLVVLFWGWVVVGWEVLGSL